LIPVIAKADTLTEEEVSLFKQRVSLPRSPILWCWWQILADIHHHGIRIFEPPAYENEDEETIQENEEIIVSLSSFTMCIADNQSKVPFAVVGSDSVVPTTDGRQVRGRAYPWGVIEVDNESHCDFVKLRQMLVRTHMEELREHTNDVLYENYRSEKLRTMGVEQDESVFRETKWALPPGRLEPSWQVAPPSSKQRKGQCMR
jgi:septin 7